MKRSVVTGGAGFLGSHLCERLLAEGHEVVCLDNLDTGSLQNIEHIRDDALRLPQRRRHRRHRRRGPRGLRLPPRQPGLPDRLPAPAAAHPQGGLLRHAPRTRTGQVQARAAPPGLDLRGLRRPARCIPSRRPTGATSTPSGRAACTTRPSGTPRRWPWPTTASRAWTRASRGSSTPTARACAPTTGGRCRPSCARRWTGKPLTVFGDGTQTRSFCYVDDLIEGLFRLAVSGEHTPVNLGNPAELSLLDLAQAIVTRHRLPEPDRLPGAADRRPQGALPRHHEGGPAARLAAHRGPARGSAASARTTSSAPRATR